jgi:hypothetical protein
MRIEVQGPFLGQASVCEPILRSLPEWFGIEEATAQYIEDVEKLPPLLAWIDGKVVGFYDPAAQRICGRGSHSWGPAPDAPQRSGASSGDKGRGGVTGKRGGVSPG